MKYFENLHLKNEIQLDGNLTNNVNFSYNSVLICCSFRRPITLSTVFITIGGIENGSISK